MEWDLNSAKITYDQCDQIGQFIGRWQLLKPLATINLPKSHPFLGNFCKGVKIHNFSSEIIFVNFYRHLAIFTGHTGTNEPNTPST